jgi:hypothetical protein
MEKAMSPYYSLHERIDVTPSARQAFNTLIAEESRRVWLVRQRIIDPDGEADFGIECRIDLSSPRDETGPLIELLRIAE